MAKVVLQHIHKKYDTTEVVKDFNLEINDEEMVVFAGRPAAVNQPLCA